MTVGGVAVQTHAKPRNMEQNDLRHSPSTTWAQNTHTAEKSNNPNIHTAKQSNNPKHPHR
jgi:hypothetical protein